MKKNTLFIAFLMASTFSFAGNDGSVTLIIDAAHGGKDDGAKAIDGTKESDLCWAFAQVLAEKAKEANINVVLSRKQNETKSLMERAAANQKADNQTYYISIHMNTSPNLDNHGFGIITAQGNQIDGTMLFARHLMHVFSNMGAINMEQKNLAVLKDSKIPALVFSPGYLTNAEDLKNLKSVKFQQTIATKVIEAINLK